MNNEKNLSADSESVAEGMQPSAERAKPQVRRSRSVIASLAALALSAAGAYLYLEQYGIGPLSELFLSQEDAYKAEAPFVSVSVPVPEALLTSILEPVPDSLLYLESSFVPWQSFAKVQLIEPALPKKQPLDVDADDEISEVHAVVDKVLVIPKVQISHQKMLPAHLKTKAKPPLAKAKLNAQSAPLARKLEVLKGSQVLTVQFMASHSKENIERIKQSNQAFAYGRIRQIESAQGCWYLLTLGEFNYRAQAEQYIRELPPTLAKLKPWIRSVEG